MKIKASEVKIGMTFKSYFGWSKIYKIEKGFRKNGNVYYDFYHEFNCNSKGENSLVSIKELK